MVVGICANYYSQDKTRGTVQRVRFNDIRVTSPAGMPPSLFFGSDAEHRVRDIRIQGLVVNGRAVDSLAEGRFDVHPFVDGVVIGGGPR